VDDEEEPTSGFVTDVKTKPIGRTYNILFKSLSSINGRVQPVLSASSQVDEC
jgi:hypothetical protein